MLLLDVKCSPVNVNYARNREGRTTVKNTDEVEITMKGNDRKLD